MRLTRWAFATAALWTTTATRRRVLRRVLSSEEKGAGVADRDLSDESLGELSKRLAEQTSTLVRQELMLARKEMQHKGKLLGIGGGLLGGAGLLGFYAVGLLLATIVLVLVEAGIVPWLSTLIVMVVVAAVAGALALVGKKEVQTAAPPTPERAMRTSREDLDYVKERARRR
jgi:hypothetical protein